MRVRPLPPIGEYTATTWPWPPGPPPIFSAPIALPSSFAPPGSTKTASIASSGRAVTGFCGTVTTTILVPGDAFRMRFATSNPLTLPWSSASTSTTSGFSVEACAIAASAWPCTPLTWISGSCPSSVFRWSATCGRSSTSSTRLIGAGR